GCGFVANPVSNVLKAMPNKDVFNNSTVGPYSQNNPNAPYGGAADTLAIGIPAQVEIASVNALDNQGTVIRQNATLQPNIYTIALEGNDANDPPDTLLLRKLANEPTMQNDPSTTAQNFWTTQNNSGGAVQTVGYFVDAP